MANDYRRMWESLGVDLEAHDQLLSILPPTFGTVYMSQENRPEGMEYFNFVFSEVHGLRIQELQEHKAKGGKVIGAFCVFVPEEIIRAAGGICVGLCSGADIGAAKAEQVLHRNICPLIQSFMGFNRGKDCHFESCDMVVGKPPATVQEEGFEILNDYVRARWKPQMKRIRTRNCGAEVRDFLAEVENFTGNKVAELPAGD